MDERRLRVLLVEDDEDDYLLTRHALAEIESPGFDLDWASTFDDGLAAIRRQEHDVVLVDNRLGLRTGLELLKQAVADGCQMPIIMLTGSVNREMDVEAMEAGAADYLEKDVLSPRLLERSIRYAIERRQAAEALARERALLRTLVDNVPDLIYVKDRNSRLVFANEACARFTGLSVDDLVGKWDYDYYPPELAAQYYAEEQALMASGQSLVNQEAQVVNATTRQTEWVSFTKVPLRDAQGNVIGLVGISRDITERKHAEGHRIQLEVERTKLEVFKRFVGDVSHDLRTPLSIMTTSLYLLRKGVDSDRLLGYLQNLEEQTAHMQKIVEDLFTLSRLEMAESEFRLAPDHLNTLVRIVCQKVQPLAEQKNHQLSLRLADDLPPVALDQQEFSVALHHLLVNALNYTPDGGQITIATYLDQGQVVFEVHDNGIGISAKDIPHIFERFYRVDKARAINTGGFGLGLAITRRIVEVHGGQIEVESTPGAGSVFLVRLPPARSIAVSAP